MMSQYEESGTYLREIIEWEKKFGRIKYHPIIAKEYKYKYNKIED